MASPWEPVLRGATQIREIRGSSSWVRNLLAKNQQCENIEYTVRSSGTPVYTEHYHFTSCLQPDGTWKIA
jgi:hypothetical protein